MFLTDQQIKMKRTEGTVLSTLELAENLELSSVLSDVFMYTKDPIAKELIKRFEFQLIELFDNPKEFKKGLHTFFLNNATYIKKNNLYKEFYSFFYFVFTSLSVKRREEETEDALLLKSKQEKALDCYYNLLFQQVNYFVPHPKIAYGLDSRGRLMMCEEPFPHLDTVLMTYVDKKGKNGPLSIQEVYSKYQKMGYPIRSEYDFNLFQTNDQLITNMIITMAYFINENTKNIHPKEYHLITDGIRLPKAKNKTGVYKKALLEKRYFLPKNGAVAQYKNCEDIAEVFYQEVFTENRIVLLYKVTTQKGKQFNGFYDTKLELFYSPWYGTNNGLPLHHALENFILESYSYLTTDIDEKIKEKEIEKNLFLEHEVPVISTVKVPTVKFLYDEAAEDDGQNESGGKRKKKSKKAVSFRTFDKRSYEKKRITIYPFVRKLPKGASASPEALELAKSYHFVLREGETFVRPFERTSYQKEK